MRVFDIQELLEAVKIEHRASPEILNKEENEWQHAVLIAGGQLVEKGQIDSKAFEQEKKRKERTSTSCPSGVKKWFFVDRMDVCYGLNSIRLGR